MVITSWLTALHGKFFGKKLPSRTRLQQSKAAGQATQAAEGLEQRALLTTLTVVAVNDVYQNVPGLDEDSDFHQDAAGGVLANDPAGTGTRSAIQVGTDPAFLMAADGSFEFDATKLPLLQSLQHGQTQDFLFQYAVSDDNGIGTPAFVDLKIQGLNDPTTATNTDQSNGFTEDQGSPVALGAIVVSDVDANDQITASLSLSDAAAGTLAAPGATFSNGVLTVTGSVSDVNSALGSMTFSPAADYDQDFTIDVNIADGLEDGTAPATGTISMTATAVPDDPIAKDSVFTINEDSGTYYGTLLGSDPDTNPPASLTFALVGAPPTLGAVNITDPATGDFTYTPNTDANGTDTFQFQVTDETLRTSSIRTVTVTINPVNDVPTFTEGADQNVLEDDPAQTVNGWATGLTTGPVTAVDEAGQALHFNVSNDNNSLFAVQPAIDAAGNLTYTLAANANGSATVMVTLSDNGGTANGGVDTSDPQTFAINVTPVNDVPAFSAGADQNVLEDAAPQSIANWATPVSAGAANESGQALTFNVTGNTNPSLFSVAPAIAANGTLTYTLAPDANGSASITITLSDDGGMANGGVDTSASQTFAINVTPVNDAPTFTKGADQTVLEDAPAQTVNGWVTSMAPGPVTAVDELVQLPTFNVTNDNNGLFAVQPAIDASGNLSYTLAANANGTATVMVTLSDNGGTANGGADTSASQTFLINVTPVNDVPSFNKGADQTVLEDATPQSIGNWATSISAGATNESGQTLTFNVTGNTNPGLFSVAPAIAANGTLTYTLAPDANGSANITITLSDNGGTANSGVNTSASQTFAINVTPVNDAPTFTKGADQTVLEDAPAQTVNGWVTSMAPGPVTAVDELVQLPTFNVTNDNNGLFAVQPAIDASGNLTYTLAANANGTATVMVTLSDNGGTANGGADTSASQTFQINVTPVNDVPSFAKGADQTVLEDTAPQSVANWATAISAGPTNESGQALIFNVTGNTNPGLFSVAPAIAANGTLTYTLAPDANGSANITITLSDNGGTANSGVNTSASQTFAINVTPVNDAPTFTKGADQTVLEDAPAQTVNGWVTSMAPGPVTAVDELVQLPTFNVTNDNNGLFAVQPAIDASGNLTYTLAANVNGTATVMVTLSDNGGTANGGADTSASQTFLINVTPVNDVPSFNKGGDQTRLEDAGQQTVANWATSISAGPANESGQALTFNVTGNTNPSLFLVAPAIAADGTLTYTLAPDANGSADITLTLSDNGGTANGGVDTSASRTFTINATAVNDAPSFVVGPDQNVLEDAAPQTVTGFATSISAGPTDENGQALTFNVSNDNNSLFSVQPAIDATGNLTYTLAANANGTATVMVTLNDNGGTANGGVDTSAQQTFAINVTPVNDAPSFNKGGDQTRLEDAGPQTVANWATSISAGPANESGQALTFNVTGNTSPDLFSVAPAIAADGTLTYTLAPAASGTAVITLTLSDGGGTANGGVDTSISRTFTITATAVNDAPSFVAGADQNVLEDAAPQTVTGFATSISAGPTDENGQALTFNVSNDNNSLFSVQPAIDSTGNLTYTLAADANGTATVMVTLSDDGGTDNGGEDTSGQQTFAINVTPVNDAPLFAKGADQTALEDADPQVVANWATSISAGPADESGQALTFNVTGNTNPNLFSVAPAIGADGTLTYTLAPDANGSADITLTLSDDDGTDNGGVDTSASQTFTINATAVNDAPSFIGGTDQTVLEDAPTQTISGFATAISAGPIDESSQSLTFNVTNDNNDLFSVQPAIDSDGNLTYTLAANANGIATVMVTLSDDGGTDNGGEDTSGQQTFQITATPVNDAPRFYLPASPDQTILEDAGPQTVAGFACGMSAGPADESGQALTFNVSTDADGKFSTLPAIDPVTGDLTYETAPNANGDVIVTVTLSDDGGVLNGGIDTSVQRSFTIHITPVNDPPVANDDCVRVDEDQTININVLSNDYDVDGDPLEMFVNSPAHGTASINNNGTAGDFTDDFIQYTPNANFNGTDSFSYFVTDHNGGMATAAVTIHVRAVNDAPVFTVGSNQMNLEDTGTHSISNFATGILPGPASATDEAGQNLTFNVTNDNNSLFLSQPVLAADGTLSYTLAPDANGTANVTVTLGDDGGVARNGVDTSAPQTFQINVTPVNDVPSFTEGSDQTVSEDSGPTSVTGWATGISAGPIDEAGQALIFQIVDNSNAGLFSIAPSISADGTLTYTTAANANGMATITIQLMDGGGTQNGGQDTSATQTFNIVVTPVNDAPTFSVGADQNVLEDSGAHTVAGWATGISAGPTDETGQTLAFSVTVADPTLFSVQPTIDAATGTLTYTLAANANGSTAVTVTLSDNGGTTNGGSDTSVSQTFNITANSVNDAPSFVAGTDTTVLEDAGAQTVANWATAISKGPANEAGQTLSFTVTATDPSLFSVQPAIDPVTGNLTFTPAANANGSTTLTVTLMDNGGTLNGGIDTSSSQTFHISITPVNDAPGFIKGADISVLENAGPQVVANWATSLSKGPADEASQTLTFNVTAANPALFSVQPAIDPVTGNLSYTLAPNVNGSTLVTVTLSDNGGTTSGGIDTAVSQTFNITVNPVNAAPSFNAGSDETVVEDSGAQTVANWATGISKGPSNESGQTVAFTVTAADPSLFSVQPAIDPATGNLTFTPAANANGSSLITVTLHDDGGTVNGGVDTSASQTFHINITAVNDAPSFTRGGDRTVLEDAPAVSVDAWASGILSGPANESGQVLTFNVTAADPSLFSVQPSIDPVTGTLTFTPAANQNGSTLVTVTLSDDGGSDLGGSDTSTTQTFNITITGVNDAPSFSLPANPAQSVNEDGGAQTVSGFATNLSAGPADESGQTLSFVVSNDNTALFTTQPSIDSATGALTYTLAANANGTANVTVLLHDNGGTASGGVDTSAAQVFVITVNAVNDAPSFTKGPDQTVIEDAGAQTVNNWATNVLPAPLTAADEFGQTVDFIVTNDNNALFSVQPTISSTGRLTYQPAANANGTATITVKLHDDGGVALGGVDTSASQTFTISVVAQNDPPTATDATLTVPENSAVGTVVGTVAATDPDVGDTKSFAIISGNSNGTFAINAATGQITIANNTLLNFETNPTFNLIVKVTDSSNAVGTANITINLTNVNDPLVITLPSAQALYVRRGGSIAVDPAASTSDEDMANIDFSGGTLRVSDVVVDHPDSHDRLGVLNQGTGTGKISVSGNKIYFETSANQIGTIVGGKNGGPLVINLTSGATQTAVNALLKAVSFHNTVSNSILGVRNITFDLSNASGTETASASQTLKVVTGTEPPVITLPSGPVSYTNRSAAVALDSTALVTDIDSPNFNTGILSVTITQGVNSNNRLTVANVGGITVTGKDIFYNGVKFGRLTAGNNTMSVTFNSDAATPAATQALVRALTFATASSNTNLTDRVIQLTLSDGDGGKSVVASKTVFVGAVS